MISRRSRPPRSNGSRGPDMNPRALFGAMLVAGAVSAGCGPALKNVSLQVSGNVKDASVTIDDQYIGSFAYVQKRGVAMPPGKHRITIEKVGYFPWDKIIEATE